jgi:hypothetical protein
VRLQIVTAEPDVRNGVAPSYRIVIRAFGPPRPSLILAADSWPRSDPATAQTNLAPDE